MALAEHHSAGERAGMTMGAYAGKRVLDVVGASLGLLLLLPLLAAVAVLVRIDSPGPVLFRQVRVGQGGRTFRIIKFRTLLASRSDVSGVLQVAAGDKRLTPLGPFLRRTSLDELPQLLNVLKGEMSLVGPRPHVSGMLVGGHPYEIAVEGYMSRYAVRPGMTGWAQVNGLRGPIGDVAAAETRVRYDLDYIRGQSLALDLKIICLTIWREVFGKLRAH